MPRKLPRGLRLGNCAFGALMLWWWGFGSIRLRRLRSQSLPHCEVVDEKSGRRFHFRVRKDFLPLPLSYLLFWGELEERRASES